MAENKQLEEARQGKKVMLTFFLMLLPSLLLAMTRGIESTIVALGFQVVLLVYQAAVLKSFLNDHYGLD